MHEQDMSGTCGFRYFECAGKVAKGEMTEEEFAEYYKANCAKCSYMSEICMYGEE